MTTSSALLVIDVQRDVVDGAADLDGVLTRINHLMREARRSGAPVIVVQHDDEWLDKGSPQWQLHDALEVAPSDPHVEKHHRDSFAGTTLEQHLREADVERLVITGAASDFCVNTTAHAALARGYDVTLVSDAHTTGDLELDDVTMTGSQVISFVNEHFRWLTYPGRSVVVQPAAEVRFRAEPGD